MHGASSHNAALEVNAIKLPSAKHLATRIERSHGPTHFGGTALANAQIRQSVLARTAQAVLCAL
jgi:hypothetical protein